MGRISIHWKITGLLFFILGFSLFALGLFLVSEFINSEENELQEKAMLTARTVAELPDVSKNITAGPDQAAALSGTVERIRMINKADYITVLDMGHVRLTHPIKEMVGTVSKGADEGPAFAENSYTSKAKGEIGVVVRAFAPVIGSNHEQIGVVIAGYKVPSFIETIFLLKNQILLTAGLGLFLGGWGAWVLASHIKKQMFQLEPHEIARLFTERTEAFNAIHEGIIAIDKEEKITIFNRKAKEMLGIEGDVTGNPIWEVLPDTRLPEILQLNEPIFQKEFQIRNLAILSNRVPIKVNGETVGAIAIFQDRTQVKKLAEELTGVRAFVNALRVQNHEHMNKLHTIAGLIQLGNREKALEYVFEAVEVQEELTSFLSNSIKDESLTGLLLSKVSRGKELGIEVTFDPRSTLEKFPSFLDHHDFVLVIGNLIENAFDSFKNMVRDDREIYISIQQTSQAVLVLVEDNGCGIPEKDKPLIFERGYSSKAADGRGIGLYLVKQIVEKGNGEIEVDSTPGQGTSFSILFPLEEDRGEEVC